MRPPPSSMENLIYIFFGSAIGGTILGFIVVRTIEQYQAKRRWREWMKRRGGWN